MKTLEDAKKRALWLQSRREHSRFELKQKLSARGFSDSIIEEALNWLVSNAYQDDKRFIKCYICYRKNRGYGPLRIGAELRQRGIAFDLIKQQLGAFDACQVKSWLNTAMDVWHKKLAQLMASHQFNAPLDASKFKKILSTQVRFLSQRGFTGSQIDECIRQSQEINE